jgi:hypothetical protein
MMSGEYRSGGGFWLLKRSLHNEQHAVVPSSLPPLSIVYRQMKCQRVPAQWFRKIVRPISGGIRMLLNKLKGAPHAATRRLSGIRMIRGCTVSTRPNPEQLSALAAALRLAQGPDHVDWDEDTVRWRFFHPLGPVHGFVDLGSPADFALISLGPRDGLAVGRLIFVSPASPAKRAVAKVCRILTAAGAHVILAMTAAQPVADSLLGAGFSQYPFDQETYFYHRDKEFVQSTVAGPEITDIGFESLMHTSGPSDRQTLPSRGFARRTEPIVIRHSH